MDLAAAAGDRTPPADRTWCLTEVAEALNEAIVCVMSRNDVYRLLFADPRISPGSPRSREPD